MAGMRATLIAAVLLVVAPDARAAEKAGAGATEGTERAADVMGGQGRGSGSGKLSFDHTLGSGKVPARIGYVRRPDDPRDTQRQPLPTADAQPSDPKMTRIGGTPGETPTGEAHAPGGSPAGSAPQHESPTSVPGAGGRP